MNCQICGTPLHPGAMFCGECGSSVQATAASRRRPDPRPSDTSVVERLVPVTTGIISVAVESVAAPTDPEPADSAPLADADSTTSPRFALQFSTGEKVTVFGTGLIGRRPLGASGERFDHLVQIADRSLSVSKTHVEFGEHEGTLWVADRFSGNGTVVRHLDGTAVRCEPGRRYLVPRGSRVELAEQSFVVS